MRSFALPLFTECIVVSPSLRHREVLCLSCVRESTSSSVPLTSRMYNYNFPTLPPYSAPYPFNYPRPWAPPGPYASTRPYSTHPFPSAPPHPSIPPVPPRPPTQPNGFNAASAGYNSNMASFRQNSNMPGPAAPFMNFPLPPFPQQSMPQVAFPPSQSGAGRFPSPTQTPGLSAQTNIDVGKAAPPPSQAISLLEPPSKPTFLGPGKLTGMGGQGSSVGKQSTSEGRSIARQPEQTSSSLAQSQVSQDNTNSQQGRMEGVERTTTVPALSEDVVLHRAEVGPSSSTGDSGSCKEHFTFY